MPNSRLENPTFARADVEGELTSTAAETEQIKVLTITDETDKVEEEGHVIYFPENPQPDKPDLIYRKERVWCITEVLGESGEGMIKLEEPAWFVQQGNDGLTTPEKAGVEIVLK